MVVGKQAGRGHFPPFFLRVYVLDITVFDSMNEFDKAIDAWGISRSLQAGD